MYLTSVPIIDTDETIVRPLIINVANDIKEHLNIKDDVKVFLDPEELESIDRVKDNKQDMFDYASPRNEYLSVTANYKLTDEYDTIPLVNQPIYNPIYYDPDIDSKITPSMQRYTFNIEVIYFNKSRAKIVSLLNRMRRFSNNNDMYIVHKVEYYYILQNFVLQLLNNINILKNKTLEEPLSLGEYIANTFTVSADWVNSLDGDPEKSTVAIRERQLEVIGYIEDSLHNIEKEVVSDKNGYSISFNYKIELELPNRLYLQYPILVYNRFIHKGFRIPNKKIAYNNNYTPDYEGLFRLIFSEDKYGVNTDGCLKIPNNDVFKPNNIPLPGYKAILSTIIKVDPNDKTAIYYIDEIPGLVFEPSILELLAHEVEYVDKLHNSIFYFRLFNGNKLANITVKAKLIDGRVYLYTDKEMDIKGYYRVTMEFLYDLDYLSEKSHKRIDRTIKNIDNENTNNILLDALVRLYVANNIKNRYETIHVDSLRDIHNLYSVGVLKNIL